MIQGVESKYLPVVWKTVKPMLVGACKHSFHTMTLSQLHDGIASQKMQLWLIGEPTKLEGVMVTKINIHQNRKHLCAVSLGGKDLMKRKEELVTLLKAFAKDKGCQGIEIYGRKGVARVLKDFGFETKMHIIGMEV